MPHHFGDVGQWALQNELSAAAGQKRQTIDLHYVRVRDGAGNESDVITIAGSAIYLPMVVR